MNELLSKFILAAKAVLYDAKRAAPILAMLTTKSGAVNAVHVVMAVIEKHKPIPPDISNDLAVAILKLIVDIAKEVTGAKVPPKLIADVTKMLTSSISTTPTQPAQPQAPAQAAPAAPQPAPPAPQPRGGLINQGA